MTEPDATWLLMFIRNRMMMQACEKEIITTLLKYTVHDLPTTWFEKHHLILAPCMHAFYGRLASSPGPSPAFQLCTLKRKAGNGPGDEACDM